MKRYTVAKIDVVNTSWVRDYVREVTQMVERAGRAIPRPEDIRGEARR